MPFCGGAIRIAAETAGALDPPVHPKSFAGRRCVGHSLALFPTIPVVRFSAHSGGFSGQALRKLKQRNQHFIRVRLVNEPERRSGDYDCVVGKCEGNQPNTIFRTSLS